MFYVVCFLFSIIAFINGFTLAGLPMIYCEGKEKMEYSQAWHLYLEDITDGKNKFARGLIKTFVHLFLPVPALVAKVAAKQM